MVPINHDDDVEDEEEYTDTDLGAVEEHKSIILHLLSQLKLGMDLTKVIPYLLQITTLKKSFRYLYYPAKYPLSLNTNN